MPSFEARCYGPGRAANVQAGKGVLGELKYGVRFAEAVKVFMFSGAECAGARFASAKCSSLELSELELELGELEPGVVQGELERGSLELSVLPELDS